MEWAWESEWRQWGLPRWKYILLTRQGRVVWSPKPGRGGIRVPPNEAPPAGARHIPRRERRIWAWHTSKRRRQPFRDAWELSLVGLASDLLFEAKAVEMEKRRRVK